MSVYDGFSKASFAAAAMAVLLAGCSTTNTTEPVEPAPDRAIPEARGMSAGQIRSLLAGKSWRFRGPNNSGVTLYAEDGTSLVDVDGKGTTAGTWSTKDGMLCESFSPAPFIPKGVPLSCYPFKSAGGKYQAGKATFEPA